MPSPDRRAKNILFIMFDQLRWDYLSCYGHPHLPTPNIDRLAAMGVRFDNARIQSPLCGPSRMSTYTGRYVHSHGASWNNVPLKVGEMTMGDHLRALGMGCWLVGKTHMQADAEGLRRLGLEPDSVIGARLSECGFDVYERDDGMRPEGPKGLYDPRGNAVYNDWLRERGYQSDNPWHDYANSGVDDAGNVLSGWFLQNSDLPANIDEADSETSYMTRRGIEFIESQGDTPWLCHLSLIKPHWPYIVPAPYHDMFGPRTHLPPVRSQAERATDHPVMQGFLRAPVAQAFGRDDIREKVLRAYMGLIKQCDDQMGVLFDYLDRSGRMADTMIVVTSDHGDYLGDHWLGEKMFFHDTSIKVPLIIYDPDPRADATRGTVCDALVEQIDLLPSFVEVAGGRAQDLDHILEGHSLRPLLHGEVAELPRGAVFCEYDWSHTPLAERMGLHPSQARMFMAADRRWKLITFENGARPMLFDLAADPQELTDLGASPDHQGVIRQMSDHLFTWARRQAQRQTKSNAAIVQGRRAMGGKGVLIGVVDETQVPPEETVKYRGRRVPPRPARPV
jgi:arylsulfatase A-like enzyme